MVIILQSSKWLERCLRGKVVRTWWWIRYWEWGRGQFQEVLLFFCHEQSEEWCQSLTQRKVTEGPVWVQVLDILKCPNGAFLKWNFPSGSVAKKSACDAGDPGSIPGWGRSPGGGNGNMLWYCCLGNPMHREAWQAAVHGSQKSWIWLSN